MPRPIVWEMYREKDISTILFDTLQIFISLRQSTRSIIDCVLDASGCTAIDSLLSLDIGLTPIGKEQMIELRAILEECSKVLEKTDMEYLSMTTVYSISTYGPRILCHNAKHIPLLEPLLEPRLLGRFRDIFPSV